MAEKTLAQKLLIKPGYKLLLLNAPEGYAASLGELPQGASISTQPADGAFDFVQVFMITQADADRYTALAIKSVKQGGLVWLTYAKGTSKIKSEVNRDKGWDVLHKAGWDGVSLISVDSTWSAMRVRPASEVKYTPGSTRSKVKPKGK